MNKKEEIQSSIPEMQVEQYKGIMSKVNAMLSENYKEQYNIVENITQQSNLLFDSIETIAIKQIDENIRNHQVKNMSFLEKHIYMDKQKVAQLQSSRELKTTASIMGIKLLSSLAKIALKKIPEINKSALQIDIAKGVTDIFKYTEHQINKPSDSNKTIVMSTIRSLASDKEKYPWQTSTKKIQQRKIITNLYDFNIDSKTYKYISSEKEILGLELHKIYSNYDVSIKDIINKYKATYELLGFTNTVELQDFLRESQHRLDELSPIYCESSDKGIDLLLYLASTISADINDTLKLSKELIKYDPIKESREKNMQRLKDTGTIVAKVATLIGGAYSLPNIPSQVMKNAYSLTKGLGLTSDQQEQIDETMNELLDNSPHSLDDLR